MSFMRVLCYARYCMRIGTIGNKDPQALDLRSHSPCMTTLCKQLNSGLMRCRPVSLRARGNLIVAYIRGPSAEHVLCH
jgi:hypothetical protein